MGNIQDSLGLSSEKFSGEVPSVTVPATKRRKSSIKIDELENAIEATLPIVETPQNPVIENISPVIPTSLVDSMDNQAIDYVVEKKRLSEFQKISKIRAERNKLKAIEITEASEIPSEIVKQEQQEILSVEIEEVKSDLESVVGEELPENINYVELETELHEALLDIPDGDSFNMMDITIKAIPTKTDKSGYFKSKIGSSKTVPIINQISSAVAEKSKGLLFSRDVDLRVLANTNKTQLRGSKFKLHLGSVVYKPRPNKLKVNKGTRIIVSKAENFDSTGNLYVYLQESRSKTVIEIASEDFNSPEKMADFISSVIADYYTIGYQSAIYRLRVKMANQPIQGLIRTILMTREYKCAYYADEETNHIFAVDFKSLGQQNQWLTIQVLESEIPGKYDILAENSADQTWNYEVSKGATLRQLEENLYHTLGVCYSKDWTKELGIENDDDKFYYLYDKLSHAKLKKAMLKINESKAETGIEIVNTYSKKDTAKEMSGSYDAESIIGKAPNLDFFILTFLAYQIKGGDKRNGKDYITSAEYYEKYSVKDTRPYEEREKTIVKKQDGSTRNYNSRPYVYQLEYSSNGVRNTYVCAMFDDLINQVGFMTDTIKFPKSKY